MAQGVKTNLDTDLNGQASLPYGGYLGVGFLSNFDYDFYSPAPARGGNSYQYSQGVRYDLFGSALQAHLTIQVRDIVYLNYYDADDYYHIQSTVTYDYYGTDGTYLGQESTTGLYGYSYSVNVPDNFGNYYIEGSTIRAGLYPKHDENPLCLLQVCSTDCLLQHKQSLCDDLLCQWLRVCAELYCTCDLLCANL